MPYIFKESQRPEPWRMYRPQVRLRVLRPLIVH